MPYRFATFLEKYRLAFIAKLCVLMGAILLAVLFESGASVEAKSTAAPSSQELPGVTGQLYLIPLQDVPVQLNTHIASINITDIGDGSIEAAMDALTKTSYKMAEAMYAEASAKEQAEAGATAGPQPEPGAGAEPQQAGGETVDADFTVVDDDKKEEDSDK